MSHFSGSSSANKIKVNKLFKINIKLFIKFLIKYFESKVKTTTYERYKNGYLNNKLNMRKATENYCFNETIVLRQRHLMLKY